MVNAIGVERAQDLATKGKGTVSFSPDSNVVVGEGTSFIKDLNTGSKLKVGDVELNVKSVDSDTVCICDGCCETKEKAAYKVIPRVDQTAVYSEVHKALKNGDCIGIFPEGGSHDRASLLDLKPGVAIMALGAMKAGAGSVKIVPCGLNYFDPYRFRSRVIVEFGDPLEIPSSIVEQYGDDKRGAVAELMKLVDDSMKGVMPGARDYDELQALLTMRALYKPRGKKQTPEELLKMNKMFAMARIHMGSDPRWESLLKEVSEYTDLLRSASLRDRDVRLGLTPDRSMFLRTLSAFIQLVVLTPLTLPTLLLGMPVALITTGLAKREKRNALASSSVKVRALDVVASYKILVALVVIPIYDLLLSALLAYFLHLGVLGLLLLLFFGVPGVFLIGIRACDLSVRCLLRCRATFLFHGCLPTAGLLQKVLVEKRTKLQERVQNFVEDAKLLITAEALQEEADNQSIEIDRKMTLLEGDGVVPAAGSSLNSPLLDKPQDDQDASWCVIS
eukprot:CAMPEP_0206456844 /NCGR_PEP_ID=MMETSP0324_2-20121206/22608_1 /ASSEMBLY_ACC=CAM_ASM_000836 /TAXON_ID=2866 /ORGANISM="Crypthecodinium cohnii, Strain Seligo" /LENGTH=503 /DNA_ID=CAMNT_0053927853 /DNA_START=407 /DNA_END=1918 /DNA_ORIENTATION=+